MSAPPTWKFPLPPFKTAAQVGFGLIGLTWAFVSYFSQSRSGHVPDTVFVFGFISGIVFLVGAAKSAIFYAGFYARRGLDRMESRRIDEGKSTTVVSLLRVSPLFAVALYVAHQKIQGGDIFFIRDLVRTDTGTHPAFITLAAGMFITGLAAALIAKDHFRHKDRAVERRVFYGLNGAATLGATLLIVL